MRKDKEPPSVPLTIHLVKKGLQPAEVVLSSVISFLQARTLPM
jgi:hypothetical protein